MIAIKRLFLCKYTEVSDLNVEIFQKNNGIPTGELNFAGWKKEQL
jgi:hypothetical protein